MFGEISTKLTDKQLVNTAQTVELAKNILREKFLEDEKDDEPTLVKILQRNSKLHIDVMMKPQDEFNSQNVLKSTNVVTANGFLCAAPGCVFLSQNFNRDQEKIHYNLLHSDLTFAEDSFIAINAEMAEAIKIFKEVHEIKKEIIKF